MNGRAKMQGTGHTDNVIDACNGILFFWGIRCCTSRMGTGAVPAEVKLGPDCMRLVRLARRAKPMGAAVATGDDSAPDEKAGKEADDTDDDEDHDGEETGRHHAREGIPNGTRLHGYLCVYNL